MIPWGYAKDLLRHLFNIQDRAGRSDFLLNTKVAQCRQVEGYNLLFTFEMSFDGPSIFVSIIVPMQYEESRRN